ncbi:hypothetical protein RIU47_08815 [Riemerella anatipestifer]|uniref:hypothetical protein n=1 Tax=Riemerella anatipestifer TaxID=34085 RepID=UPI00286237EC|nr:hypothetical protein [Riemerella anatipestifer]MDR7818705.1 hypothetical protein [Riemerella anatipestifer]MDR7850716.1 hypothetical protein [Riemerella anatipestifer]MDR7881446.1 hypothetical protein [Riemerella anatipestifer]MDY3427969.1 hypothetical protein [Riemerella anatipestifer]
MSNKVNIGLASIKIGEIASDGGMGTSLEQIGVTNQGSCKINFEDAEKKEFFVEEYDDPFHVEYTQGKINIQYQIANPDIDTIVKVFGGSKSGSGPSEVYKAPNQSVTIERSMEMTPKKGLGFKFPRVSITAKFTPDIGKENLLMLDITASVLRPTKDGEPRFSMFKVA